MSEKDYTQIELSETLRDLCKEKNKRIEELEDNAVIDQANIEALVIKVTELEAKLGAVREWFDSPSEDYDDLYAILEGKS